MAKFINSEVTVTINSVDLTDHVRSVNITEEAEEVDVTAMGSAAREILLGTTDASIEIEFFQDFASGEVHQTLEPLQGSNSTFPVVVKPTSGALSATNPGATMTAVLPQYSGLSGAKGEASTMTVTFRNASQTGIVWDTTP